MQSPLRKRRYLHPLMDDHQWDEVSLRNDDVIIVSAIKAGTTWLQTIVANLIFQSSGLPGPVMEISPWVERYRDAAQMAEMLSLLNKQTHRRFLKTHLPLDALNYSSAVKYLYIGRDPRDVFVSLFNHHQNYSDERQQLHEEIAASLGVPWPAMPEDIHEFYARWIDTPYFDWESEGSPYWSIFYHCQSWWQHRNLDNIKLVHYDHLLTEPQKSIAEIAEFLGIFVEEAFWSTLLNNVSFDFMKNHGDMVMGKAQQSFKGGAATFINRGQSQAWREVLSAEENARYRRVAQRTLSADAISWLETGSLPES